MDLPPDEHDGWKEATSAYKKMEVGPVSDSDSSDAEEEGFAHYVNVVKEMPQGQLLKYGGGGAGGIFVLYYSGMLERLALNIASQVLEGALIGCGVYFLYHKALSVLKGEAKKVTGKVKGLGKKVKHVPVKLKDTIKNIEEKLVSKLKEIPDMVQAKVKEGMAKSKARLKAKKAKRQARLEKLKNGQNDDDDDDRKEFQVEFEPSWASTLLARLAENGSIAEEMPPRFVATDRDGAAVNILPFMGAAPSVDVLEDRFPLTFKEEEDSSDSSDGSSDAERSTWRQRRKNAKSPADKLADKQAELQAQKDTALADPQGAVMGFFQKSTGVNLREVKAEQESGGVLAGVGKASGMLFNHAAPPPAKWLLTTVQEGHTGAAGTVAGTDGSDAGAATSAVDAATSAVVGWWPGKHLGRPNPGIPASRDSGRSWEEAIQQSGRTREGTFDEDDERFGKSSTIGSVDTFLR